MTTSRATARRARRAALAAALVLAATACSAADAAPGRPRATTTTRASATTTTRASATTTTRASATTTTRASAFPWHDVIATVFWVGEAESADNGGIPNRASAWDDRWMDHYGGVDDPDARRGYLPAAFTPKENPFYVALPYNDFDANGNRKATAAKIVPWAAGTTWTPDRSMLKNQWVELRVGSRTVFAQWEDVGPFGEDDSAYVFGTAAPRNRQGARAGIDLSPAVRDALAVGDVSTVSWRFVTRADVPSGPWTATVTTSGIDWR